MFPTGRTTFRPEASLAKRSADCLEEAGDVSLAPPPKRASEPGPSQVVDSVGSLYSGDAAQPSGSNLLPGTPGLDPVKELLPWISG